MFVLHIFPIHLNGLSDLEVAVGLSWIELLALELVGVEVRSRLIAALEDAGVLELPFL